MGDSAGNITRLDNAIDKIPENIQNAENKLENLYHQMENAKVAIDAPFPQEAEYQDKMLKLAEVEAKLSADNVPQKADETKDDIVETFIITKAEQPVTQPKNTDTKDVGAVSALPVATDAMTSKGINPQDAMTATPKNEVKSLFNRLNDSEKGSSRFMAVSKPSPSISTHKSDDAR